MITRWLVQSGGWKSITASERLPWKDTAGHRYLGSHEVARWWQNELALIAAPCFEMQATNGKADRPKTLFTLFSTVDRMHRPQ